MKTEILSSDHPIVLAHAVDILQNGGTVVFPTDTVYGLAALPFREEYVERLYVIKGRNSSRAIAVLISDSHELEFVSLSLSKNAIRLAERFWPGPLTLIVPRHPSLPDTLSRLPTIGVRVPNHPIALALLRMAGPLAVTSANLSGQNNTNSAEEVLAQLNGRVHLIIDGGQTPGGIPSTVVDCTSEEVAILRPGPISLEDIHKALN